MRLIVRILFGKHLKWPGGEGGNCSTVSSGFRSGPRSTRNGFIGKCESRRLSASENEAELTAMHLTVIADDPFLRDAEERCKRVPAKDDATGEMLPTDSAFFSDGDTIL